MFRVFEYQKIQFWWYFKHVIFIQRINHWFKNFTNRTKNGLHIRSLKNRSHCYGMVVEVLRNRFICAFRFNFKDSYKKFSTGSYRYSYRNSFKNSFKNFFRYYFEHSFMEIYWVFIEEFLQLFLPSRFISENPHFFFENSSKMYSKIPPSVASRRFSSFPSETPSRIPSKIFIRSSSRDYFGHFFEDSGRISYSFFFRKFHLHDFCRFQESYQEFLRLFLQRFTR